LERFIYIMQDADAKPAAIDASCLPHDLSACHALILEQARVIVEGQESRAGLGQEVEELKAYVQRLLHQLYGRRRERSTVDPKQGMLDFGDDPAAADALAEAAAAAGKIIQEYTVRREVRKQRPEPRQEKFPAHFPRVEETIEPPREERECPEHGPKQPIGYDIVETLEFQRPKLWVRVRKYAKYVCPSQPECGVAQAERPTGLVEGSRYGTSVAAEVTANKYAYHLPLYREQDLFAGSGWTPSRSTLMNLLAASAFVLQPFAEYLRQLLLASGGVGCDDTRVTLIVPPIPPPLDPANPRSRRIHEVLKAAIDKGQPSVTARIWGYRSFALPINVFDFTVSWHRDGPDEILRDYTGLLMADCYSGFEGIELRSDARIVRAACWAHARRKVYEIQANHPQPATVLLAMARELYDIEDQAKGMTAEERLALRQREARPVLARIRDYLEQPVIRDALPKSDLAKATGYLRKHWELLQQYTCDGRCPIDNNDVEQLMKQIAVGRKNWLFVGSVAGGERAATLMTIVSSAIRNDLDVAAYLKDVLDQLLAGSTDYASLCPHAWKLAHPEAIRSYRVDERRNAADRKRVRRARRRLQRR
jgi:transposase